MLMHADQLLAVTLNNDDTVDDTYATVDDVGAGVAEDADGDGGDDDDALDADGECKAVPERGAGGSTEYRGAEWDLIF